MRRDWRDGHVTRSLKAVHPRPDQWRVIFPSNDAGGRRPEDRKRVIALVDEAMAVFYDREQFALLPGNMLAHILEHDLPQMAAVVGQGLAVRGEQSWSKPRAEAEAEVEEPNLDE